MVIHMAGDLVIAWKLHVWLRGGGQREAGLNPVVVTWWAMVPRKANEGSITTLLALPAHALNASNKRKGAMRSPEENQETRKHSQGNVHMAGWAAT